MDISELSISFSAGHYLFSITLPFNFHINKLEEYLSATPYMHEHAKYEVICVRYDDPQQRDKFIVIPPLVKHRTYNDPIDHFTFVTSFQFLFQSDHSLEQSSLHFQSTDLNLFSSLTRPVTIDDTFSGWELLLHIQHELSEMRPAYCDMLNALFFLLLANITRQISSGTGAPVSSRTRVLDDRRLDIIDLFFRDNYSNPYCQSSQLADLLCVSQRHLLRILQDNYRKSFRELLLQTRMEIAEAHRKCGPITVAQLAERIGYSCTGSFLSAYRRYFGHSFRRENECSE